MADELDKMLEDIEAEKMARLRQEAQMGETLRPDEVQESALTQARQDKISSFKLSLNLEDDAPEEKTAGDPAEHSGVQPSDGEEPVEDTLPEDAEEKEESAAAEEVDETEDAQDGKGKKGRRKSGEKGHTAWGCIRGIIYAIVVLAVSGTLAYFAITGGIDMTGLNKSDELIDVEIPAGANTETVANILKENGLIDQPLVFRLYSKITKADGKYQVGTFTLSPDMGYSNMIARLQTTKPRETVRVTIPEGSTAYQISQLLEKEGVCSASDFFDALVNGEYENAFLEQVPQKEMGAWDEQHSGRIYRLDGYLFPDTYEFFKNSSGKTVVQKMLDNFETRMDTQHMAALKAAGMTLDDAITLASIIQGEAADLANMPKVSRVLHNRLDDPVNYPYLQCDSTARYVTSLIPIVEGGEMKTEGYDTYTRKGLPAGPINNPGLAAIEAAISPSTDEADMQYYFFANDAERNTYYSRTYEEHVAICRKHHIGIHG
ncbi:MAG: endolytic transglycosylase MltG [Clostridiales bacterium]|nr:endolytic transglycosylase MltG [Clostridiales bacterium]